jgi:NADPH2:quinone reductase
MRAWQIQRHGEPAAAMECVECEVPEPGPGEVRVKIEAAALGLPDVFMCRGTYAFRPELPFTPGQEVSGTVSAVGEGASFALGDRVMGVTAFFRGFGGLAEYALALDASLYPWPDVLDSVEAAAFVIPYHTAYLGLETRGRLSPGETLLVLGAAGGSGSAAVSLGHALGARVIAAVGGSKKAELCRALGADLVIDHQQVNLADAVREATDGRGADVIFDPVGGPAFDQALDCIANEGRLLGVGYASGEWRDASTRLLVAKNASVVGVFVGAYQKPFLSDVHEALIAHAEAGRIRSLVSREVGFDEVADALGELAERRASGKVVVCVA